MSPSTRVQYKRDFPLQGQLSFLPSFIKIFATLCFIVDTEISDKILNERLKILINNFSVLLSYFLPIQPYKFYENSPTPLLCLTITLQITHSTDGSWKLNSQNNIALYSY